MLSEAIEYPLEGDDAPRALLVGGGLSLASGALGFFGAALSVIPLVGWVLGPLVALASLVPTVLLGGYAVAVSRSVLAGGTEPPAFDDWGRLGRDGLSVAAITLLYWVPGLVLGAVGAGLFVAVAVLFGGDSATANTLALALGAVGSVAGFGYLLLVGYLLPAALVAFARTGSLSSAWDVAAIRTVVTEGAYVRAWAVGLVVLLVANSVGSTLAWFVVGFLVLFYGQVAAVYVFTRGTMDALGLEAAPAASDAADSDDGPGGGSDGGPAAGSDDGSAGGSEEGTRDGRGDGAGSDATGPADDADADPGEALADVSGVGPTTAEALRDAGFESVAALRAATRTDLVEVTGIGPATADRIKDDVGEG